MKIGFIKKPEGLFPVTPWDIEKFKKIQNGLQTILDIKSKRNVKLFRKYWAVCRMIADNSDKFKNEKHVSDALLIVSGFREERYLPDGSLYLRPDHLNWESCSDEKFKKIWEAIMPWVIKALNCTEQEINDNLIFYM